MFIQVDNVATSCADFGVDSGRPMSGETSFGPRMALFIARTYSPDDDDGEDKMVMMVSW